MSTQADKYRSDLSDYEIAPPIDASTPGKLPLTPELKTTFLLSLRDLNITIRFFSGSWNTFHSLESIGLDGARSCRRNMLQSKPRIKLPKDDR